MDARTRQAVQLRAGRHCEYCRLPDVADEWPFHVDHVVARVHGGVDEVENLSWSCTQCNLHKGSNFASIDPLTRSRIDLFNPRQDEWHEHFAMQPDGLIVGRTSTGRATARLLDMNGTPQLDLRRSLLEHGEFDVKPP
jgi:hypothetical protein